MSMHNNSSVNFVVNCMKPSLTQHHKLDRITDCTNKIIYFRGYYWLIYINVCMNIHCSLWCLWCKWILLMVMQSFELIYCYIHTDNVCVKQGNWSESCARYAQPQKYNHITKMQLANYLAFSTASMVHTL